MDNKAANKKDVDYILVNVTEELVKNRTREMMRSYDICQCNKCFSDICAIVLNKMAPRYVTTEKGSLMSLLSTADIEVQTELTVNILQALMRVKTDPKH